MREQETPRVNIDNRKVQRLARRIIITERDNLKSQEYNDSKMVDEIIKMIEEEINAY